MAFIKFGDKTIINIHVNGSSQAPNRQRNPKWSLLGLLCGLVTLLIYMIKLFLALV